MKGAQRASGRQVRPSQWRERVCGPAHRLPSQDIAALSAAAAAAMCGLLVVAGRLGVWDAVAVVAAACAVPLPLAAARARRATRPARAPGTRDLRQALGGDSLELYYQPQVTPAGETTGMEALLRRRGPDGRLKSAVELIEHAERNGLMPRVTGFVLDTALAQAAAWHRQGLTVMVSVNISPTDAAEPGFTSRVRACLARHMLPGRALTLEVTESTAAPDLPNLAAALTQLRDEGVRVSLDDFGTGHSSITRLRQLPVDELKIDRSFVSGMATDLRDQAVVRCSVSLAHCLGLDVVAEGVEREEDLRLLQDMGVTVIQGWLVSPALAPADATRWLRQTTASVNAASERGDHRDEGLPLTSNTPTRPVCPCRRTSLVTAIG